MAIEAAQKAGAAKASSRKRTSMYDDILRELIEERSHLILPLVNLAFGEHYTREDTVCLLDGHQHPPDEEGEPRKQITDAKFTVTPLNGRPMLYHFEYQSKNDPDMGYRISRYDMAMAMNDTTVEGNVVTRHYARSAVLYLRSTKSTPDEIWMAGEMGGEELYRYRVPCIKLSSYSLEQLFEKDLDLLVPFWALNRERQFRKCAKDSTLSQPLVDEFAELCEQWQRREERGGVSSYDYSCLLEAMSRITDHVAIGCEEFRRGFDNTMARKYLLKTVEAYHKGEARGEARGEAQGSFKAFVQMVHDKLVSADDLVSRYGVDAQALAAAVAAYKPPMAAQA